MTRIAFWEPSGEMTVPGGGRARVQYTARAFSHVPGLRVPFRAGSGGQRAGWATVVSVAVDPDGYGATWTVDLDLDVLHAELLAREPGFAFRDDPDGTAELVRDPAPAMYSLDQRRER